MSDFYTVGEEGPRVHLPPFKPVTVDFTLQNFDPEVLALLCGQIPAAPATFSLETHTPIKRTLWQWLRRRSKQWHTVIIPNAQLGTIEEAP